MTEAQERRFSLLQNEWCDFPFILELYGIDLRSESRFLRHFQSWAQMRGGTEVVHDEREIHRYRFETFLQTLKLLPKKWGALRLGMKVASLEELLGKLGGAGLVFCYYPSNDPTAFVGEKIDNDILDLFEELRFRAFSDHNHFCLRMHRAIQKRFEFEVEPEFDITSRSIYPDKSQWDYAHDWDAITLEPVSLQFQVWLDLGKPMNLRPDCCSTLFYAQERDLLREYVTGTGEPDIPPELVGAVHGAKG